MQLDGRLKIEAAQEAVWRFLTSPEAINRCVPEIESLAPVADAQTYTGQAFIRFGSTKLSFPVHIRWQSLQPPQQGTLVLSATISQYQVEAVGHISLSGAGEEETFLDWRSEVILPENLEGANGLLLQMAGNMAGRRIAAFLSCVQTEILNTR